MTFINQKNTSTACNTRDTFMMIHITLYVQFSEPTFNALQFPNSFICHQLYVFTNHCISPTLLLQTTFILRPSTPPSFLKKTNTQTTASMSLDSSSSSSGTTMSSNSSSVLSKASLKLFRIYIEILLTIFYFVLLKF